MINDDLMPPKSGLNANPVLYGVAAGLASLFPPVMAHAQDAARQSALSERDEDGETPDAE
jgi:hypothetical protein